MPRPEIMPCVGCETEFHPSKTGPFPKYCSRSCKDKQPRDRDPEKVKAYARKNYENNREWHKAKNSRWAKEHPNKREKQSNKIYRMENREKVEEKRRAYRTSELGRQKEREYRQATKPQAAERSRIWQQAYRDANREEHREKQRQYRRRNPAKVAARQNRRRTRKTNAGGFYTAEEWMALLNVTGHKCLRCDQTNVKLTADHVVPVCMGGSSFIWNIQPLCLSCNCSKHKKIVDYRCANA